MSRSDGSRIGIICRPTHHVFEIVGQRLGDRGHEVTYFEPGKELPQSVIETVDILVCKKDCNAAPSFRAAGLETALTDSIHNTVSDS